MKTLEHKMFGFFRGKVVDNQDPEKLGRIKVEIFGIFDNINSSILPWAVPAFPLFVGSGSNFGSFSIPEKDSNVWCFFENGDFNQPVYFAEAVSSIHGQPSFKNENYPERRGFQTKNNIKFIVDDYDKKIIIEHPQGVYIIIDSNGIVLHGPHVDASGASGTFKSADDPSKTIVVEDGIVISIS